MPHSFIIYQIEAEVNGRGVELGEDARDVSLPTSSDYQTVPSNNFDQTIKYMCMFL